MEIIEKKIAELQEYENNPRRNEDAVKYVTASIKEFGFKVPVIIDKDNVIVAGHTRVKAAQELGMKTVPCIVADDLTEEQIKAFRLADNKVAEFSLWDFNILGGELGEIDGIDMSEFGFKFDEMDIEDFGTDFELPNDGEKEIGQMTFTLHQKQKELIEYAIDLVKDDIEETFGNTNKNGNALYEVVRQWAEQKR